MRATLPDHQPSGRPRVSAAGHRTVDRVHGHPFVSGVASSVPSMNHPDPAAPAHGAAPRRWADQTSIEDLGRPLHEVTFTVVDLETTGSSLAEGAAITEIGAVKVRGGEVLGEFQSLVRPEGSIPAFIQVLTGISDAMVADAPPIAAVLPAFLEFAAGTVLVAHNAPFDIGFLKHHAEQTGHPWPGFEVLDTVRVARRVITRDDAPNCKLSSLAVLFNASTTPNHRALSDARATVDVLHGLMERVGGQGVQSLEDLQAFSAKVSSAQRGKRHLADPLPHAPGVYLFKDGSDRVLYVGTSRDLRTRVRTYFTASETRSRMGEMIAAAEKVDWVECRTSLEAEVAELRLIAAHRPPYNRRSRNQRKQHWVKVTDEPWPRLSLVRAVKEDAGTYLGPFTSRAAAEQSMAALHEAFPIRQCSTRFPREPTGTACALAEMGRCVAPCEGGISAEDYRHLVAQVRGVLTTDPGPVASALGARMDTCADRERFEEAAKLRDRLGAFLHGAARSQRLRALTRLRELVAIRRGDDGRWAVHVVRHGRLAATGVIPPAQDAHAYLADLRASAEAVATPVGPQGAASAEESERVLAWLETPGVRLAEVSDDWCSPVHGAGRMQHLTEAAVRARSATVAPDERGLVRPEHPPTRWQS